MVFLMSMMCRRGRREAAELIFAIEPAGSHRRSACLSHVLHVVIFLPANRIVVALLDDTLPLEM